MAAPRWTWRADHAPVAGICQPWPDRDRRVSAVLRPARRSPGRGGGPSVRAAVSADLPVGFDPGEAGNRIVQRSMLRMKVSARAPRFLTVDQQAAVVAAARNMHDRFLVELMFTTGLRIGEACGLHRADMLPAEFARRWAAGLPGRTCMWNDARTTATGHSPSRCFHAPSPSPITWRGCTPTTGNTDGNCWVRPTTALTCSSTCTGHHSEPRCARTRSRGCSSGSPVRSVSKPRRTPPPYLRDTHDPQRRRPRCCPGPAWTCFAGQHGDLHPRRLVGSARCC